MDTTYNDEINQPIYMYTKLCGLLILVTYTAVQSQKAVSAHFTSKQIPPFGFAEQNRPEKRIVICIIEVDGHSQDNSYSFLRKMCRLL